mgnify:CR=1 FL=1
MTSPAGELYLAALCFTLFGTTPPVTITEEGGWSSAYSNNNFDSGGTGADAEYLIGGAGGTYAGTWTLSQACQAVAAIATFQAAGGGGGGIIPLASYYDLLLRPA